MSENYYKLIASANIQLEEVANVNSELAGDRMTRCLQIKRGCFYVAKANVFCENAARSIGSPNDKVTQIIEFSPHLLKSPRDCCRKHNRLPASDVVSGDSMDFDINGVPLCCSVPGYVVPEDLDPFANITTQTLPESDYTYTTSGYNTASTSVTVVTTMPSTSYGSTQSTATTTDGYTASPSEYGTSYTTYTSSGVVSERPNSDKYPVKTTADYEISQFTTTESPNQYFPSSSHPTPTPTYPSPTTTPTYSYFSPTPFNPPSSASSTYEATATTEAEIVCEPGFKWNSEKQLCLHTLARCPKGMYLSVSLNKCMPKIGDRFTCPKGYEYRNDLNGCEVVLTVFTDIVAAFVFSTSLSLSLSGFSRSKIETAQVLAAGAQWVGAKVNHTGQVITINEEK
ncbi:unnamed protein product [Rodentolepis nana]|uniref:Chitin-binding type-2 domain-containing protein n=1 Tax=Rodentolepis nana TaxID=102285 RepID=A0A0R3TR78_RODNA|nr:unnamed protein product [Rodentolepis nana]